MRILRRPQSCVLCVSITRVVEPSLVCKEGDIKNINSFRLNKICKPFTVTDSFLMIRRSQFLHRCYFAWEEFQFFSDRFMRCCKPDIFLLRQLARWFWWTPQHSQKCPSTSHRLDGLPLRSGSNTEPVSRNFSVSLRTALRWGTGVNGYFSANCSCTKSVYLLPSRKTYSTKKHGPLYPYRLK